MCVCECERVWVWVGTYAGGFVCVFMRSSIRVFMCALERACSAVRDGGF